MAWLSKLTSPFVWLLDRTSAAIFRLMGLSRETQNHVTAEELHLVVAEAQTSGVLEESERAIISGIVRLADRPVREVMEAPFPVVDEGTPLDRLAPVLSHESAAALVARSGALIGIVSRYDLMREMIGTR